MRSTVTEPIMPDAVVAHRRTWMLTALALGAVWVIWGSTYLAIRFGLETLPPFFMGGVRFLIAGSAGNWTG